MLLENISLINFKNYLSLDLSFSPEINCFVGNNGAGKTNLLDAIHYLSLTKSAFNNIDQQNINHQQDFFSVKGSFRKKDEKFLIHCSLKSGQKKVFKKNKITYDKISEHIGEFPIVLIMPYDTDLIREGSESRRKFFDGILSQLKQSYLQTLLQYNHLLKQRNSLLKQFVDRNYFDKDTLDFYDKHMINLGKQLHEERQRLITELKPVFKKHFDFISSRNESVDLTYNSDLSSENFEALFRQSITKDRMLQRTSLGIHKDDYEFTIEKNPLKKFGSQGQQKSFIIALKLAQFDLLKQKNDFKPLLLMDDVFDKLDEPRIHKLIEMVARNTFGQIFITDARPERTRGIFEKIDTNLAIFEIKDGRVVTASS